MNVSVLQVNRCKPILGLNAFDHAPVRFNGTIDIPVVVQPTGVGVDGTEGGAF